MSTLAASHAPSTPLRVALWAGQAILAARRRKGRARVAV